MSKALLFLPFVTLSIAPRSAAEAPVFHVAQPVWPEGREREMNLSVRFRAVIELAEAKRVTLTVAASTIYRAFVNGAFCGHGPARGPHGYYRVDHWDLTALLRPGKNVVAIEVAGYNVNSYYLLDQPAFLQAEVVAGDTVLAATGYDDAPFGAGILPERLQKVQRYSFQRTFTEFYRLTAGYDAWRTDAAAPFETATCQTCRDKRLLPRRVPYPKFAVCPPVTHVSSGTMTRRNKVERPWKDRTLTGIGQQFKGYPEDELELVASIEMQHLAPASKTEVVKPMTCDTKLSLGENAFHVLDFGLNRTGFIGATVTCRTPTRVLFTFDEILLNDDVDFRRMGCVNVVGWEMQAGRYVVETIEPYTLRYLKLIACTGECDVETIYIREYKNPDVRQARFVAGDERLNELFTAGVETFCQNAVDVFMDCPSRERAGWLCDSFFTARVAYDLSGNALVEHNFFENFLLPDEFAHLPKGMLPMCYPSDHYNGNFIPNWAMWFVVQLEEYLARSGDRATVDALKPKVLDLFQYFERFQNDDGLLEKLERWVFIEWSAANRFVQDVNYPTNMLYAAALAAAGRLYGIEALDAQAERIRNVIREQSFDGQFFVDNAVRKDGKLGVTNNRTEVCQYFAFFFGVATPESHAALWRALRDEFGPERKETKAYPDVHMANSFVGNMLRIELLAREGRSQQILDESVAFLLYMAQRTGTLWENVHARASCNHAFASHIVHTLYRDILGVRCIHLAAKRVYIRFAELDLDRCEGTMPTRDGLVSLEWEKQEQAIRYRLSLPEGYQATVENLSGKELVAAN